MWTAPSRSVYTPVVPRLQHEQQLCAPAVWEEQVTGVAWFLLAGQSQSWVAQLGPGEELVHKIPGLESCTSFLKLSHKSLLGFICYTMVNKGRQNVCRAYIAGAWNSPVLGNHWGHVRLSSVNRSRWTLSSSWPMSPQLDRHLCPLTVTCDPWNDVRRGSVRQGAHLFKLKIID